MNLNSKRIRARLILADMTQRDLAQAAGVGYQLTGLICRGASCSRETAEKLAAALGVTVEQLQNQKVII